MATNEEKQKIINKGQLAISATCDFEEHTWTFLMVGNTYAVTGGEFIIIPKEEFEKLTTK